DKASVRGRDAKSLRDATVLALGEVRNDSKADTAQLTKQINEENNSVAYDRTLRTSASSCRPSIPSKDEKKR
ncbi:hypothetical protein V3C99_008908, partial [Haemonchus contortus]